jgi:hypothetical protein
MGGGSNPYNLPNLTSIFDGTSLNGWNAKPAGSWNVTAGALHSLGAARGFLYTTQTYGSFRLILKVQDLTAAIHQACVLVWGPNPAADSLAGIQMQVPNGAMWDYRPGKNNNPTKLITMMNTNPRIDAANWSECEILADQMSGTLKSACCELPAPGNMTGAGTCKTLPETTFVDPTAGKVAPIGLQVHSPAMNMNYKDLYVEVNPTNMNFVTTQ